MAGGQVPRRGSLYRALPNVLHHYSYLERGPESGNFKAASDRNEVRFADRRKVWRGTYRTQIISHPGFVLQAAPNPRRKTRKEREACGRMPAANANGHVWSIADEKRQIAQFKLRIRALNTLPKNGTAVIFKELVRLSEEKIRYFKFLEATGKMHLTKYRKKQADKKRRRGLGDKIKKGSQQVR